MIRFLWDKLKKFKHIGAVIMMIGLFLGLSPYLAVAILAAALALDAVIEHLF